MGIQYLTTNFPSLQRHLIGFDRMFNELDRAIGNANSKINDNYPPYNIVRLSDTHYVIEVAVAGFGESEIDIEIKDKVLSIKGQKTKDETAIEYVHKGIGTRSFERTFTLLDNVQVKAATVKNGILAVALEHIIPEEQKPKKIQITFNS